MHSQFRYSTKDNKYSVTMDDKLYFETITDVNRYASFLRKMANRCAKFLDRRRLTTVQVFLMRWKKAIASFAESDLKTGHFEKSAVDTLRADHVADVAAHNEQVADLHARYQ